MDRTASTHPLRRRRDRDAAVGIRQDAVGRGSPPPSDPPRLMAGVAVPDPEHRLTVREHGRRQQFAGSMARDRARSSRA
jgi:hypothetical protein